MNKKRYLMGILLVVSVVVLAAFQPWQPEPETAVSAAPISSEPLQTGLDTVNAEGKIVPLFFSDLSFQTGGVVAEILVEEGDVVAAGDPLIRLDAVDVEIAHKQAEARLVSARAGLVAAQNQRLPDLCPPKLSKLKQIWQLPNLVWSRLRVVGMRR